MDKKELLIELNKLYKKYNNEKRLNMWIVNNFSVTPLTEKEERDRKIGAVTAITEVIRFIKNK